MHQGRRWDTSSNRKVMVRKEATMASSNIHRRVMVNKGHMDRREEDTMAQTKEDTTMTIEVALEQE